MHAERGSRREGIFGGTFDPPHVAHLALARAALDDPVLALDAVRFVPAGQPYQKGAVTPAPQRAAMLRAALADAGEPRFVIDPIEIDREGPSYTIDTAAALAERAPHTRFVLLLGQDQYAALHTWHRWRELLALVDVGVAARPGAPLEADAAVRALPHTLHRVPILPTDVSATTVRATAAAGGDISQLVSPGVARYIARHRLYRS